MKTREDELRSLIPRLMEGDRTAFARAEILFFSMSSVDIKKILDPYFQSYETDEAKEIKNISATQQAALGYLFMRAGMYKQALLYVKPAAEQGESFGQIILGLMYRLGRGVTQDFHAAVRLYQLAANQGNSFGQVNLAHMYRDGLGVTQDYREAIKWYRLAVLQDNFLAQCSLAEMYRDGRGVPQDNREAARLFQLSAQQGYSFAQNSLGTMYFDGRGVDQNDDEAAKLFRLAAEQGNADGQFNLGFMYEKGRGVAQDYGEALKLYELAADQSSDRALNNLGHMYRYGYGVARDTDHAAWYYRLAMERRNELALQNLKELFKTEPTFLMIYEFSIALLNCGKLEEYPDVIAAFQQVAKKDFEYLRLWLDTEDVATIEKLKKLTIIEPFFERLRLEQIREQDVVVQKFQHMKRELPQGVISHIMRFLGASPEESVKRRDVIYAIHKIREEKNLEEAKMLKVLLTEFDQSLSPRSTGPGAGFAVESKHPELRGEVKELLALTVRIEEGYVPDLTHIKNKFLDMLNKHRLSGADISAFEMRDEKAIAERRAITLDDLNKYLKEKVSSPKKTFRS